MPSKIKKRSNGSYLLSVAVGYDDKGKQIVKTKTVKVSSMTKAMQEYNVFAAEVQKGTVAYTGKYKLTDFAKTWYNDYCLKNLAPKTQRSYKNHLNNRIVPALGHIDMIKLRPQHIIQFLEELKKPGLRLDGKKGELSGESIMYCFRVLSSMLQDAMQWQIINNNPCNRVKAPTVKRHKYKLLSEEEIKQMLQYLDEEQLKYRMIVLLAIDSGLRLGELMALKWSDIDMKNNILNVTKSNQALGGKGVFTKSPKNESSVRNLVLSASIMELLKKYSLWQKEQKFMLANKWHDENWLFTKWDGQAMYPTTPSQWFRKFLKRKGLPHMPFHALRHLSATLLISLGIPLKNVSNRLGHADIRTTANIYSEALQSVDEKAANKMDQYFRKVMNK
ncbi:tyrosine recombinase XerC [Pectinatus brassicae]|uniref:Integrase n=1 Tax=Pectinatus brassicae TaxID=862415 RepID=A0A840UUK1_9FIRM|nr:site-specific integrase [Pectinatus brassicae]MBB5336135.1 integrase [Pectinatus brassicae]